MLQLMEAIEPVPTMPGILFKTQALSRHDYAAHNAWLRRLMLFEDEVMLEDCQQLQLDDIHALKSRAEGHLIVSNSPWVEAIVNPGIFPKQRWKVDHDLYTRTTAETLEQAAALDIDDLRQVGLIALSKALKTWDPCVSNISTWSKRPIGQAISHELVDIGRTIRLPGHIAQSIKEHQDHVDRHPGDFDDRGYKNSINIYIPHLDQGEDRGMRSLFDVVAQTRTEQLAMIPDYPSYDLDDYEQRHIPEDEIGLTPECDVVEASWSDEAGWTYNFSPGLVKELLDELDERDRKIIDLRYGFTDGEPHTLREVAVEVGLRSPQAVLNRQAKILEYFKELFTIQALNS